VIAKPVIAKPSIKKAGPTLSELMESNKVTDDEVIAFCKTKGMKEVPEYVGDFSPALTKRLVEIFDEVITFSLAK
jgi:hypothetical protein